MFSMELVFALGALSLIHSAPVLEEGVDNEDTIWMLEIANTTTTDFWNESAVLVTPATEELIQFSCNEREDGIYHDPLTCSFYYRCFQEHREVYKCLDGYFFNPETIRCEEMINTTCQSIQRNRFMFLPCHNRPNGLYTNYSTSCQDYYRCQDHSLTEVHSCKEGFAFSPADQACLPLDEVSCVTAECAEDGLFVLPGTMCRVYYECRDGWRRDHSCPGGETFDMDAQVCVASGSACYEPLCTGRVNGRYPDTSHACRRSFLCSGGRLTSVSGCPAGQLFDGRACHPASLTACQLADSTAVVVSAVDRCMALPDGRHGHVVCEGGRTAAVLRGPTLRPAVDCSLLADGLHADPSSGCRRYAHCLRGGTVAERSCPEGSLFNGAMCLPAQLYACPFLSLEDSKCSSLDDGFRTDYASGCGSYLFCSAGRVVFRSSCGDGLVWDGDSCVSRNEFACEGPEPWSGCLALEPGFYQDKTNDSICRKYYHCAHGNRTRLTCPENKVFDGQRCVSADTYKCPSQDPDSCENRSDGYYTDMGSNCRSYFYCSSNHKITYVCAGSYVFNGKECVDQSEYKCTFKSQDCSGLPNGYHYDKASGCRKYFYCLGGDKVITLTCAGHKVFDGHRCVPQVSFQCPKEINRCATRFDGKYADTNTGCRRYFQCVNHKQVTESFCLDGKIFNGTDCVPYKSTSACSSNGPEHNSIPNSSDCGNSLNGFYQDQMSGCRRYFYCIDGVKTVLTCPSNQLFDGQLCVDSNSYSCPIISMPPCKNNLSTCNKTDFQSYVVY